MEVPEDFLTEAVSDLMIDFEELARATVHRIWDAAYARGAADNRAQYEKKIRDALRVLDEAPLEKIVAPSVWKERQREKPRRWTDYELEKLQATAGGDGDYEALGKHIGRTAIACEQQARTRRWYKSPGPGRWAVVASPEVVAPAPADRAPAPIENDDAAADLDDLTKATRDVLLAMSAAGDNAHLDQIAVLAETPADRVPGAIHRLAELKLAQRSTGKWSLTDAGAAMALKVKEDEA